MSNVKLSDYATSTSDSVSLACIDGQGFTITKIERNDYTEGDKITKGVKITTKESYGNLRTTDGEVIEGEYNKFHTVRKAVTAQLLNEDLMKAVNEQGKAMEKLKCVKQKGKGQYSYYTLVPA